ncbi:hemolysin family protein [Jiella sp. MQZ9-1]|uniref:HlyC/CorC family transporter n=1 Tax=Jiella flava TaxID=2816857 RepID=A0A939JUN4_9HYPH|nr:hemolysin family protein [Jiella flava]MBO0661147.1 HlyC/CorC family transporter [Jiella flava]MCD2469793.1 hemolysin family protein [Jiella flava]
MLLVNAAIVFALIVLNGFFAMSELAVVSARKSRLEQLIKERRRGARIALKLAESPTTFLSSVQIGITLVGIFAGAFGGSVFAAPLAAAMRDWPVVGPIAEDAAFFLVVLVITYFSLVIGELVPKRLALAKPEAVACFVAPIMRIVAMIGRPLVFILEVSTRTLAAVFGLSDDKDDAVTEEDVRAMIAEGTQTGVFKEKEREMLEGVISIADRNVRSIMVPRPDVDWLALRDGPQDAIAEIAKAGHSRFPIVDTEEDAVVGIVQTKDILERQHQTGDFAIADILREPLYVNEAMPILKLLERFRGHSIHMAIVLDEYGSFEGIATPQDILSAIAGSLPEGDEDEPKAFRRRDGSWLIDGSMAVEQLARQIEDFDVPQEREYETLAGLALEQFGHIPDTGERIQWSGFEIEVVDLDGRRIDKLLLRRLVPDELDKDDANLPAL